jgi:hypothetical protein
MLMEFVFIEPNPAGAVPRLAKQTYETQPKLTLAKLTEWLKANQTAAEFRRNVLGQSKSEDAPPSRPAAEKARRRKQARRRPTHSSDASVSS